MGLWHKRKGRSIRNLKKIIDRKELNRSQRLDGEEQQHSPIRSSSIPTIWTPLTDEERRKLNIYEPSISRRTIPIAYHPTYYEPERHPYDL